MKRFGIFLLAVVLVLGLLPPMTIQAAEDTTGLLPELPYYYHQLTTDEARGIYEVLCKMLHNGDLKTGTRTVSLTDAGITWDSNTQAVIMADFSAARDAFMFDHAGVFYVDFDKLSVTYDGSEVLMGVGRDTTYFRTGFTSSDVTQAIADFDKAVEEMALTAAKKETLKDRVYEAYTLVTAKTSYALEQDAKPANVNYVRTPYGALVRGESVCEGYARGLKAVLDRLHIDNVLVQGTYTYQDRVEPHMWNYVRMDDNRWYLVDATMGDGAADALDDYFLQDGTQAVFEPYQPDGVISVGIKNAFTFKYPDLTEREYTALTNAFTAVEVDGHHQVSYKGKGLAWAEEGGHYVLCSWDGEVWYYYMRYSEFMVLSMGGSLNFEDTDTYFVDYWGMPQFAITNVPPADIELTPPNLDDNYYKFDSKNNQNNIYDYSVVDEAIELTKAAPVAARMTPSNSRLDQGATYTAEVVYTEDLKLDNAAKAPELTSSIPDGATCGNFQWDGKKTITFEFTTTTSYNHTVNYYFGVENLVGVESLKEPQAVSFRVVNNPVFGCPKIPNSVTTAYASTPALIADGDLSETNWVTADNKTVGNFAVDRLALVAAPVTGAEQEKMLETIGATAKAAQTFDISVGLCSEQINYVTGRRLKVFVPFPEGYNASTPDVVFKAYHFKADGTAEEIDCVTTENGIIMMCNSFSPFTVAAVTASEVTEKSVLTTPIGNGKFSEELVKVEDGQTTTVTVTPDNGFIVSELTLNGEPVEIDAKGGTVDLDYSKLEDKGNVLEATFSLPEIQVDETIDTPDIFETGVSFATLSGPTEWKTGTNTFTVSADVPCTVLVTHDGHKTHTRLTGVQTVGGYTFVVDNMTENSDIDVVITGDVNSDGQVNVLDALRLKAAELGKSSPLTGEQHLAADLNHDGIINVLDGVRLVAALLNTLPLTW